MATPKVLTVTLEFKMGDRNIHAPRIKAAYEAAVTAAVNAARGELLNGSISTVQSRMTWDYRWTEASSQYADASTEWEENPEP